MCVWRRQVDGAGTAAQFQPLCSAVEALAKQVLVDPVILEYYNELQAGQVLAAGEWVLVPHISTPTP